MAGIWVDQGLVDMHEQLLSNASLGVPDRAVLYTSNTTPTNASVYSTFTVDAGTIINVNPSSWTFTLDAVNHRSLAQIVLDFDLSAMGGTTYYGILLSNIGGSVLYYAQLFPAPIVIPGGGINPLPIVLLDYRENCP